MCVGWIPHDVVNQALNKHGDHLETRSYQVLILAIQQARKTSCIWIVSQVFILLATTSIFAVFVTEEWQRNIVGTPCRAILQRQRQRVRACHGAKIEVRAPATNFFFKDESRSGSPGKGHKANTFVDKGT